MKHEEGANITVTKFRWNEMVKLIDIDIIARIDQILIEDHTRYRLCYYLDGQVCSLVVSEAEIMKKGEQRNGNKRSVS